MSAIDGTKLRIHSILKVSRQPGDVSWFFDVFIITLIVGNVIAMLLESIEPLRQKYTVEF